MQEQYDFQYETTQSSGFTNVNMPFYPPDPKEIEKKQIRRTAITISISVLLMLFVSFFWATGISLLLATLGVSYQQMMSFFSDPFINEMVQIAFSSILFTLPFALVFKIGGYSISETVALSKPKSWDFLPLILMGVGFCAFANLAVGIAGSIFSSFGIDYNVDFGENPDGILGFIISFIATAIIPALVEEFACRGLILGSLRKFGDGFAIVVSSFIFGLMHGNFEQIPFAFLVGIILAYITVKSGSIWIAVIIHGINNSISVLMDYVFMGLSTNLQNVLYYAYLAVVLIAAIVGAYWYNKRNSDAFTFKKVDMKSKEVEKYKFFFTSPLVIVFSVICFVEALLYF